MGLSAFGIGAGGMSIFGNGPGCVAHAKFPLAVPVPRERREKGPKEVLILMSKTGGGHKASAEALQLGFESKFGKEFNVDIIDLWSDHTPFPVNQMPKTYNFLVRHAYLWRFNYMVTQPRIVHLPYLRLVRMLSHRRVNACFQQYDPDMVVSVHPLLQHVPIQVMQHRIRQGLMDPISFATVVTDFTTCHNAWFHRAVSQCFVPTDDTYRRAMRMGLTADQITVHGLPIRPGFDQWDRKHKLRRHLGLAKAAKALLLMGGGDGMGKIEATVQALEDSSSPENPVQVVVVCGTNQKLAGKLRARECPPGLSLLVQGFVTNMNEWMCACDAIITKAGPGTIAEALIAGLPILINGNVPCQEEGNIPYVLENRVGSHETKPDKIAKIVQQWFDPGFAAELQAMSDRARELGKPDALYRIVEDLAQLCRDNVISGCMAKQSGLISLKPAGT